MYIYIYVHTSEQVPGLIQFLQCVLQRVLQCVAVARPHSVSAVCVAVCVAVCCSVLQCVAVCCSVLQRVAVCCSVLQCAAATLTARMHTYTQRRRQRQTTHTHTHEVCVDIYMCIYTHTDRDRDIPHARTRTKYVNIYTCIHTHTCTEYAYLLCLSNTQASFSFFSAVRTCPCCSNVCCSSSQSELQHLSK